MEHILIHCAEYFHVRIQCFDVDNLQELFNTVSPDTILGFIQRALGGRRSPAVACWASDHWVTSSNPLRGKFRH